MLLNPDWCTEMCDIIFFPPAFWPLQTNEKSTEKMTLGMGFQGLFKTRYLRNTRHQMQQRFDSLAACECLCARSSQLLSSVLCLQTVHPGLLWQRNLCPLHPGAEHSPVEGEDSQLHQTGGFNSFNVDLTSLSPLFSISFLGFRIAGNHASRYRKPFFRIVHFSPTSI